MNLYQKRKLWPLLIYTAIGSFVHAADWPTFRGNNLRTGYAAQKTGVPGNTAIWSTKLGGAIVSSPSVVEDKVYVGCRDSCIYAFDAITGTLIWKKKTNGWIDSSPLIFKNRVIVGSRDGNIYIFDRMNGDSLATMSAGLQLSSPGVTENGLILSGIGPPFNRFSVFELDKQDQVWGRYFTQMSYSSPATQGNYAVIGASDGRLYGIDLSSQKTLWRLLTNGDVYLSTPAIADSVVYFAPGDYDRNVYAVDLISGNIYWKSSGNAAIAKARTNVASSIPSMQMAELRRLSPAHREAVINGMRKQRIPFGSTLSLAKRAARTVESFIPAGGGIKTSSVTIDSSRVYVIQKELGYGADINLEPQSRFTLLALDAFTGNELWRFSEIRNSERLGYCSSPIVAGNKIFFGWGEGKVYALSCSTGAKLWEDSLDGNIISSPAVADGMLYVATMNGVMSAFRLSETLPGETFRTSTFFFPNPAQGRIGQVQVFVTRAADLTLTIYNNADKPVVRHSSQIRTGKYLYNWNLGDVANGVYFARVSVRYGDGTIERKNLKMAVLK